MATPTYATVISQIDAYIVANGNNEITANVLNPILKVITDFANNTIGDLDTLTTSDKTTVVNAINSLKTAFDNLNNNGVQLLTGYDDPNVTPPPSYNYADFYMELDVTDDSPIQLWQWSGTEWNTYSNVYSKAEIDFLLSNIMLSIVPEVMDGITGVTTGFAVGQTTFTLPPGAKCLNVYISHSKQYKTTANNTSLTTRWTQTGNDIVTTKVPALNNYIYIEYVIP